MVHSDLQNNISGYIAPLCEFVELGINTPICEGSNENDPYYGIEDWTTDDSNVEF